MAKKKSNRRRPQVPAVASRVLASRANQAAVQASETRLADSERELAAPPPQERTSSGITERMALKLVPSSPPPSNDPVESLIANDPFASETPEEMKVARREDESSIPPVNMTLTTHDEDAEKFFEEGERSESIHSHLGGTFGDVEEEHPSDAEFKRRITPEVLARRAKYRKIAQRVVGVFALVAAIGIGKAVFTHAPSADASQALSHVIESSHHAQGSIVAANETTERSSPTMPTITAAKVADIPAPTPVVAAPVEETKPAEPAALVAVPQATPPQDAPKTDEKAANAAPSQDAPATDLPAATPKEDKHAAQKALDKGDFKTAIARGERALESEPEDAETWLIVGAAYQSIGENAKAHRAFSSCTHHAKRGPVGECAALR